MAAVRNTYMSDYGISKEENDKLLEYCKNATNEEKRIIWNICKMVYPAIASQLFKNLTTGIGYDNLCKKEPIRMQRKDFQGYRRKTLKELYDFLSRKGGTYDKRRTG